MKALVLAGIGKIAVVDKEIPEPGPREAVIKTTASLVCTTDVHIVHGAIPVETGRTLGHESVGVVAALGSDVSGLSIGDRVVVAAVTPCGRCSDCQRGAPGQCGGMLGAYRFTAQMDGNMAEYFLVNDAEYNLAQIPDGVSDEQAVYAADMLSTGFAAADDANLPLGGTAAVFGLGAVGLCAGIGLRLLGAGLLIGVDSDPVRAALASKLGFDQVIDHTQGDPVEQIMLATGGAGVDAAVEAVGLPESFTNALRAARPGGVMVNVGVHGEAGDTLTISVADIGLGAGDKRISSTLCRGGKEWLSRLLRLMENGRVDPTPLTTHRFPFSDIETAFRLMESKKDGIVKPLITF